MNSNKKLDYKSINMKTLRRSSRLKPKEIENKEEGKEEKKLTIENIPEAVINYNVIPYISDCDIATQGGKACIYKSKFLKEDQKFSCRKYCQENFQNWFPSLLMEYDEAKKELVPRIPRYSYKQLIPNRVVLVVQIAEDPYELPEEKVPKDTDLYFYFCWNKKEEKNNKNWMFNISREYIPGQIKGKVLLKPSHVQRLLSLYKKVTSLDFSEEVYKNKYSYHFSINIDYYLEFEEKDVNSLKSLWGYNLWNDTTGYPLFDSKGRALLESIGKPRSYYNREKNPDLVEIKRSWTIAGFSESEEEEDSDYEQEEKEEEEEN